MQYIQQHTLTETHFIENKSVTQKTKYHKSPGIDAIQAELNKSKQTARHCS
jgi:LPS O-antigen subunit length determinant protein (WzzB/FepE family)